VNKDFPVPPPPPILSNTYHFSDTLNISIQNEIKINGKEISKDKLVNEFKKHISQKTLFLYSFKSDTKYQDYITVLSSHFMAADELRKQEQTVFRENDYEYDEPYKNEQNMLKEKYPIMIKEKLIDGTHK
jgi:hypothetical protein